MHEPSSHDPLERIAQALERIADRLDEISSQRELRPAFSAPSLSGVREKSEATEQLSTTTKSIQPIIQFLASKNIHVKSFPAEEAQNGVLDSVAVFMGNRYPQIKKVYEAIKRDTNQGKGFQLSLKNASQEEVAYSCQLCNSLHQIAFLSAYKYFKAPKFQYTGQASRMPTAINFLTGQWLERFIKTEIINNLHRYGGSLPFSYLMNPQITLPNGDDFELDVLFAIGDEIFWFEAKTGLYQQYVEKYARMARLLGLDHEHAFMVLTEATTQNCAALENLFGMKVVNLEQFSEAFRQSLLGLVEKEIEAQDASEDDSHEGDYIEEAHDQNDTN